MSGDKTITCSFILKRSWACVVLYHPRMHGIDNFSSRCLSKNTLLNGFHCFPCEGVRNVKSCNPLTRDRNLQNFMVTRETRSDNLWLAESSASSLIFQISLLFNSNSALYKTSHIKVHQRPQAVFLVNSNSALYKTSHIKVHQRPQAVFLVNSNSALYKTSHVQNQPHQNPPETPGGLSRQQQLSSVQNQPHQNPTETPGGLFLQQQVSSVQNQPHPYVPYVLINYPNCTSDCFVCS